MSVKWDSIQARYNELTEILSGSVDVKQRPALQKEHSQLSNLLSKYRSIQTIEKEQKEVATLAKESSDSEIKELYQKLHTH